MHYEEFIHRVQEHLTLESRKEAVEVTEATLETLSERLSRRGRQHLAAQLPIELKEFILKQQTKSFFSLDEFCNLVTKRTGMRYHKAVKAVEVVIGVLREAITEGELNDVLSELPNEYRELFHSAPAG